MNVSRTKLHKALLSMAVTTTLFAGCNAEGQFETYEDRAIVEDVATHQHGELMYVQNNMELQAMLEDGELVLRPEQPFMGVLMNFAAKQIPSMTYSYENLDGSWSAYEPVGFANPESDHADAHIALTQMAKSLRIRFEGTPDDIDFVRAEFVQTASPESGLDFDDDWDPLYDDQNPELSDDVIRLELRRAGRYTPNAAANAASPNQRVSYNGAGAWNGGRNCSGRFLSGTRKLADYVKANFSGARSYGGYSCRRNTASTNNMSVHGTGRAIDIFVPLDRGEADNDLGDPIANWLIENAQQIGVQFIVWDRTSWGASRSGNKFRPYTGPHPHHDHLHVELTIDAAAERTPWFSGGNVSPPGQTSCWSRTLNQNIPAGECVQMPYEACGGSTCQWAKCTDQGAWSCVEVAACTDEKHGASTCAPAPDPTPMPDPTPTPDPTPNRPTGASCQSRTLGQDVPHGACVQMNYNSCGGTGTCQWAECTDGSWTCTPANNCEYEKFGHTDCGAAPAPTPEPVGASCWSKTLGRNVADNEWVQMSYNACGGTCRWAECDDGSWMCGTPPSGDVKHGHRSCN